MAQGHESVRPLEFKAELLKLECPQPSASILALREARRVDY